MDTINTPPNLLDEPTKAIGSRTAKLVQEDYIAKAVAICDCVMCRAGDE